MNQRPFRRTGLTMAAALLAATAATQAEAQGTTPEASPVTSVPDLPQGPLGEQIQWLADLINGDPTAITADAVGPHISNNVLTTMSAADLATTLTGVATELAPILVEPGTMPTTRDHPPTNARFILVGKDGLRLRVSLSVDRESGLITGLFFQDAPKPAAPPASAESSPTS